MSRMMTIPGANIDDYSNAASSSMELLRLMVHVEEEWGRHKEGLQALVMKTRGEEYDHYRQVLERLGSEIQSLLEVWPSSHHHEEEEERNDEVS